MEDKISIILPIFNVGPHLRGGIDSLINQTIGNENLEIIMVDVLLMKVERLLMNMMRNTAAAKPSTWKKILVQPMVPVTEVLKSAAAITLCF